MFALFWRDIQHALAGLIFSGEPCAVLTGAVRPFSAGYLLPARVMTRRQNRAVMLAMSKFFHRSFNSAADRQPAASDIRK